MSCTSVTSVELANAASTTVSIVAWSPGAAGRIVVRGR